MDCSVDDAFRSPTSKPRNSAGSFLSHLHIFPKVSTSGILPLSIRINVAGPIPISLAVSRSFRCALFSLTITPRLSSGRFGIEPPFAKQKLTDETPVCFNSIISERNYTIETRRSFEEARVRNRVSELGSKNLGGDHEERQGFSDFIWCFSGWSVVGIASKL